MAHYKATDSKREQFRRYLEKSGVLDTLTKVVTLSTPHFCNFDPLASIPWPHSTQWAPVRFGLSDLFSIAEASITFSSSGWHSSVVALYEEPEKPNSALDFLKHHIGAAAPENPEVEALRLEVAEMKEKYEAVLEENKKLKAKLSQYEPPPEEKRGE
ncbi:LOW QUALITY PROTEIN: C-Myc-binding protein [Gopherus evgoodei]|uniref:LOW QUALITY PROTEIN: C-Myc-binding protein n=1 Tax=Gopherus evgoodei TaxID=1825980 RepID=UPI0011CEF214|nr:LOW QUALITY PROTEIN: C-Myc-binding protein [Gopherus evgoodei]